MPWWKLWRSEETLWSHAVQLSPHSSDGWRYLGDLYKDEGRFSDAVTCYGQALASRPSDVEVRSKLGSVLARSGRVEEAERELRRALEQAACYTPALNNLANLLRERGDTSGAHHNLSLAALLPVS